jgi:hypothetical protein
MHARHTTQAGLIAVLATVAAVLAGCSDATNSGEASTRSSGDVASAPATPTKETNTAATQAPSGPHIVGEIAEGDLTPGQYWLPPVGPLDGPFAVVDIPAGYGSFGPFVYADKPAESDDPLAIGLWFITGVYLNPCAQSNEVPVSTVGALSDALAQQRLTSSTRPREFDLAGRHGMYVEVATPTDLDYSRCDDAELNLWDARPDGGYWTRTPGMVEKLWILDVDGQPMVIHMAVPPSATGPQINAMTDIVEAAAFKSPDA